MRRLRRHTIANHSIVVCKYDKDTRYAGEAVMSTHDKQFFDAVPCARLEDARSWFLEADVVGIDEGQVVLLISTHVYRRLTLE